MAQLVHQVAAVLAVMFAPAAVFAAPALADSTESFLIPSRIIATPCDAERYLAVVRDTGPVYFDRYMRDRGNRPAGVQQAAVDRLGPITGETGPKSSSTTKHERRRPLSLYELPARRHLGVELVGR